MFISKAYWPESVSTGNTEHSSTDRHLNKEEAESVCRGLERDGLGGNKKVFPIKTEVFKEQEAP